VNQDVIERARRFNRFYTGAIGMLDEGYLGSGFTLAEARVIYEVANREAVIASEIGAALGMDAGYLSRVLKRLEAQDLIARAKAEDDRRQSRLSLTEQGRDAFAGLDTGARKSMGELIEHLGPGQLQRLSGAMAEIEGLLKPSAPGELVLRQPRPGDLGWVVERHGVHYARDQGWDARFEALVSKIVAQMSENPDPKRERCWIAERDGERLGCVFLAKDSDTTARIRLLLVEPAARGLGLGGRLARACVDFAREAGYREVVLWTHAELVAARKIYADLGFTKTQEWRHADFGPVVVSETWRLVL
jgi:DNA-binding MarR family transcriptional regulator/N-acetylglutamate synthase-like GNAT family acetyltransferase